MTECRGKGSYDKALFAVKKLSENGILDCVVTTMTKYNIKDMAAPAKLAAQYGAQNDCLPQFGPLWIERALHA